MCSKQKNNVGALPQKVKEQPSPQTCERHFKCFYRQRTFVLAFKDKLERNKENESNGKILNAFF